MAKGHENLKPIGKRTTDEAREISKKGGIASGKSRRRKKALRTALKEAMALPLKELHPDMQAAIMQAEMPRRCGLFLNEVRTNEPYRRKNREYRKSHRAEF